MLFFVKKREESKVFPEKRLLGWLLVESVQSKIANWAGQGLEH